MESASQGALHHEICDLAKRTRALVEGRQSIDRALFEFTRELTRLRNPHQGGIGRLAVGVVLVSALAQLIGGRLDVEHVIDDLKGEADRAAIAGQRVNLIGIPAAKQAAAAHRRQDSAPVLRACRYSSVARSVALPSQRMSSACP